MSISRRNFIQTSATAAGGLVVGFHLGSGTAEAQAAIPELNAFIEIGADDIVTLRISKSGSASVTQIANRIFCFSPVFISL